MTLQLYEYRVCHWTVPMTKYELEQMDAQGYRLITVVSHTTCLCHYFRRLAQPPSPEVGPNAAAGRDPGDPT